MDTLKHNKKISTTRKRTIPARKPRRTTRRSSQELGEFGLADLKAIGQKVVGSVAAARERISRRSSAPAEPEYREERQPVRSTKKSRFDDIYRPSEEETEEADLRAYIGEGRMQGQKAVDQNDYTEWKRGRHAEPREQPEESEEPETDRVQGIQDQLANSQRKKAGKKSYSGKSFFQMDTTQKKDLLRDELAAVRQGGVKLASGAIQTGIYLGKGVSNLANEINADMKRNIKTDEKYVLSGGLQTGGDHNPSEQRPYADPRNPDVMIDPQTGYRYIHTDGAWQRVERPSASNLIRNNPDADGGWIPRMPTASLPSYGSSRPVGKNPLVSSERVFPEHRIEPGFLPPSDDRAGKKPSVYGSVFGAGLSAMSTGQFYTSYGKSRQTPSNEGSRRSYVALQDDQGYRQHPVPNEARSPHPVSAVALLFGGGRSSVRPEQAPQQQYNAPRQEKNNLGSLGVVGNFFGSGQGTGSSLLSSISSGGYRMTYGSGNRNRQQEYTAPRQEKKMTEQNNGYVEFFRVLPGGHMGKIALTPGEIAGMASRKAQAGLIAFTRTLGRGKMAAVLISQMEFDALIRQQRAVVTPKKARR